MTNYRRYLLYKGLSFLAFIIPFSILIAIDSEDFIIKEVTKLSLYGYIVLIFLVVAFKNKLFDTAKKNPPLSMSLILFVTAIIMRNFYKELLLISIAGLLGSILSAIFEPVERVYFNCCFVANGTTYSKITTEDLPQKEGWKRAYL